MVFSELFTDILATTLVSGPDGPLTRRYAPSTGKTLVGTTPTAHRGIFIADRPHGLAGGLSLDQIS